jgi:hypothetical protein
MVEKPLQIIVGRMLGGHYSPVAYKAFHAL